MRSQQGNSKTMGKRPNLRDANKDISVDSRGIRQV